MAKKSSSDFEISDIVSSIKGETKRAIIAIFLFLISAFISFSAFGKGGVAGDFSYRILSKLLGETFGYWIIVITLLLVAVSFLKNIERSFTYIKIIGSILFFLALLGTWELFFNNDAGILGYYIYLPLYKLFGTYVSLLIFVAIVIVSLLIIFESHITLNSLAFWKKILNRFKKANDVKNSTDDVIENTKPILASEVSKDTEKENQVNTANTPTKDAKDDKKKKSKLASAFSIFEEEDEDDEFSGAYNSKNSAINTKGKIPFKQPPLSLLERDKGKPETGDIKSNSNIIKRTLQNFGINVEMDEVSVGPSVTRYALKPAEGVKLSKIVSLNQDLALALAAHPIRIEAPIPGKSLVGIEVPNSTKSTVGLATLLSSDEFQKSEKPLMVSLGKSITGKSHFANLAKAPHMLIAGATGSGKSVTIHTIITSLLFRNSPDMMKFIFIDPKRVELTLYNKIPHLLTPVITDAREAIKALRYAGKEMKRRYDILESNSVRDIDSYHKNILAPELEKINKKGISDSDDIEEKLPEKMPYIVIVIDELADIMQTYPRELESAVVKLAQMSRAVGIHLILSTQRPSVNVITGLIKANIPTRIALQVASQIDSRTILDQGGAEKLLGAGDMLFLGGDMPNPVRLQSAYISESEVKKVVKFLSDEYKDELIERINLENKEQEPASDAVFNSGFSEDLDDEASERDNDLCDEARRLILETGQASTSFLQRRLKIGYSRGARIMDLLEKRGVIGPPDGSKTRQITDPEYRGSNNSIIGRESISSDIPENDV